MLIKSGELTSMELVIGTRGSPLALWQDNWVKKRVEEKNHDVSVVLKIIKTQGDKITDVPLAKLGGKGLFVKEIEKELMDGNIHLAVHSMKDVPSELPADLEISTICKRENPCDAFISRDAKSIFDLPKKAKLATSSLRRQAQVLSMRPDVEIVPVRGNVDTRLRKFKEQQLDAIILASAGMIRLNLQDMITTHLNPNDFVPAVGQGAMGIETRKEDDKTLDMIDFLDNHETHVCVDAERTFLAQLNGGCQVPIAAYATTSGGTVVLNGLVASLNGSVLFRLSEETPIAQNKMLGESLAEKLLSMGADKVLSEFYGG